MMPPNLTQIDAALEELAEMWTRAATVAALDDADLADAGALQVARVERLLARLDPATETGFIGAIGGTVARLGARASATVSRVVRSMPLQRLVVLTGTTAAVAIAASYWDSVAQAELATAAAEDRVMSEIIASLPPEKRAEAFARITQARAAGLPGWVLPAALVALGFLVLRRIAP